MLNPCEFGGQGGEQCSSGQGTNKNRKNRKNRKWRCQFLFPLSLSLCPPGISLNVIIRVTEEYPEEEDMEVEMVGQPR